MNSNRKKSNMAPQSDKPLSLFGDAASRLLADRPDLGNQDEFPMDLWQDMGRAGLMDPGQFPDIPSLARAGEILVHRGGCLGMGLSWMIHHLVAGHILAGNAEIKGAAQLLADAATGRKLISLAVSEPKVGAHPKYLAATAETAGDDVVLNGEKTYITNGPVADAFVVVAVSGSRGGRKTFSAFLVPRDTPGLTVAGPMEIPFLKPSPHGSIRMDDCRLGRDAVVGRPDRAWDDIVMGFRRNEDRAMTGLVNGAMARLLERVAGHLKAADPAGGEAAGALGGLAVLLTSANYLSQGITRQESVESEALLIQFRKLAREFAADLETLISEKNLQLDAAETCLIRDLSSTAGMGRQIGRLRQIKIGRNLMN